MVCVVFTGHVFENARSSIREATRIREVERQGLYYEEFAIKREKYKKEKADSEW